MHDIWSNISRELDILSKFMASNKLPEQDGYLVEFEYVRAILAMYSGLFSLGPLAMSANLLSALTDKYNLCDQVEPTGA